MENIVSRKLYEVFFLGDLRAFRRKIQISLRADLWPDVTRALRTSNISLAHGAISTPSGQILHQTQARGQEWTPPPPRLLQTFAFLPCPARPKGTLRGPVALINVNDAVDENRKSRGDGKKSPPPPIVCSNNVCPCERVRVKDEEATERRSWWRRVGRYVGERYEC